MLKNFLLAGAAIGALAWATVAARADSIGANRWYTRHFTASSNPLQAPVLWTSTHRFHRGLVRERRDRTYAGLDDHEGWRNAHGHRRGNLAHES